MIESAAYDIIKQDGIQEGMVLDAREMLLEVIQARFGAVPDDISGMAARISDREMLRSMLRQAIVCGDIQSLREKISTIINP